MILEKCEYGNLWYTYLVSTNVQVSHSAALPGACQQGLGSVEIPLFCCGWFL